MEADERERGVSGHHPWPPPKTAAAPNQDEAMYADAYSVCTRDRERLETAVRDLRRSNLRLLDALNEIVLRESRSEYTSIYSAPGEFALIARTALREPTA